MILTTAEPRDTYKLRKDVLGWSNVQHINDKNAKHLVIKNDLNKIIGTVSCAKEEFVKIPNIKALRFYALAIHSKHRNQGLGSLLINNVEQYAIRSGYKIIWAKARQEALNFYVNNGFNIGKEQIFDPNTGLLNSYVLRKIT